MLAHWRRGPRVALFVVLIIVLAWTILVLGWIGRFLGVPGLIPVSEGSLAGTYVVQYRIDDRPAGKDTLVLRRDHTFLQTCVSEKQQVLRASGTWKVVPVFPVEAVELHRALGPVVDTAFDDSRVRETVTEWDLPIERHLTGVALVVDDDNDIRFWKTK